MNYRIEEFTIADLETTDRFLIAYNTVINEPEAIAKVRLLLSDEIKRRS